MVFCVGLVSLHWFWLGHGTRRAQIRAGGIQHQLVVLPCPLSVPCEAPSLPTTATVVLAEPDLTHVVRLCQ